MYKSVEEIIKEIKKSGCSWIREDYKNYYIRLVLDNYQDDSLWIVDKKNKQVSFMSVLLFLIDPVDGEKTLNDITTIIKAEDFIKKT